MLNIFNSGIVLNKFKIGVVFQKDKLILTKYRKKKNNFHIEEEFEYPINTNYFEALSKALSQLPRNTLLNSHCYLCIPDELLFVESTWLPELNEINSFRAIYNKIDNVSNFIWDYQFLKTKTLEMNNKQNKYLIYKIKKDIVDKFINIFKENKTYLYSIVPEAKAIGNMLKNDFVFYPKKKHSLFMQLDNTLIKIYIFHDSKLVFFRHMKNELGKKIESNLSKDSELLPIIEKTCKSIEETISYYTSQNPEVELSDLYLFGDFAIKETIKEKFSEQLNLPVKSANLKFYRLDTPRSISENTYERLMALSAGEDRKSGSPIKLLSENYANMPSRVLAYYILFVGLILLSALNIFSYISYESATSKMTKGIAQIKTKYETIEKHMHYQSQEDKFKSEQSEQTEIVKAKIINKISPGPFLYHLNSLNFKDIYINQIQIKGLSLYIQGTPKSKKIRDKFTNYLSQFKRYPFFSNVNYNLYKEKKSNKFVFEIRAFFKPEVKL
jgi:hypothetical protein